MPARGGVLCDEVLRCDNVTCTKWRYKGVAEEKGETACLCGRPFTRTELRRQPRAMAKPEAKAKAQAKPKATAKAKAKAQAADKGAGPQGDRRPPWQRTRSATGQPSAPYQLTAERAAKAAKDDVALAEEMLGWTRTIGRQEQVQWAESQVKRAQEARDSALPPPDRLQRLREQRAEAEKTRIERENAVAVTEQEIYDMERRLHDERAEVADIRTRLEKLDADIEQVELQIPPARDADADEAATPRPHKLTEFLMKSEKMLNQLHGGDFPAELHGHITASLTWLNNVGTYFDQQRREREAQVASDARLAKAIAEKEAQKHDYEEEDVDATGDGDFTEVLHRGRAKKGKGNAKGKGWRRETTRSPTGQRCGGGADIGPLATMGLMPPPPPPPPPERGREPRAASEPRGPRDERRRSPRRPQGGGTPAQPGAGAEGTIASPTEAPSAPPAPPAAGVSAASATTLPGAETPTGVGQTGAGSGGAETLNPRGRPPLT